MTSEFSFIQQIRQRASNAAPNLVAGIGDDTAIWREHAGRERLITTDLLIEDVHFKLDYTPLACLGHKTLAVSLSDIAAMGGKPEFALLSLGIPKSQISNPAWQNFFDGYFALADQYGVALIGGDTSSSPELLVLDSIVIGSCAPGTALRRSDAQVGDAIYVTGELGASATGLELLLRGERYDEAANDWRQAAIRAHLLPQPRLALAQRLHGLVHAMMDVSDGLAQDLAHICEESGVDAIIDFDAVPIAKWHAVAATSNGDTVSLYRKNITNGDAAYTLLGTLDISASTNPALSTGTGDGSDWDAGVFTVARGLYNGGHADRFLGHIDDVRMSNGALAPTALLYSTPLVTFASWINGYPGVGAANGFNDDPDGDGLPNGIENVLGSNPSLTNLGLRNIAKAGSTFTFQHPRNSAPASDVSSTYRWSLDLATWTASGASLSGTTVVFAAVPDTPQAGTTTVTATITGNSPAKLFVELQATRQ